MYAIFVVRSFYIECLKIIGMKPELSYCDVKLTRIFV